MVRAKQIAFCAVVWLARGQLLADNNPPPSQLPNAVNPPYTAAGLNQPFPDGYYGADHNGSSIALTYPFTSPFGDTDHSRGIITYNCAPFTPRASEGVYGFDVWLEQQDSGGNWNVANLNGGIPDQEVTYQSVNTPNPGPSSSYTFTWTFYGTQLPPNTNFRIFVYVYLFNQGGSSQGNFYVASSLGTVNAGAASDPPRISWAASLGSTNPTQVQAAQTYTISANAQDDNGNLAAVSINKNGQPFAYAGGGNGYSGNSGNPTSDPVGSDTYTAWATNSYGGQSPTISWTVSVVGRSNQAAVSSSNASLPFYSQTFTPSYFGGSGTGGWQFVVVGYTNWDGGVSGSTGTNLGTSSSPNWAPSWSPPGPGSYSFWVVKNGDTNFNPSNSAGPYTLTVTAANPVGSFDGVSPNPVTQGQAVGGSGWAADAQTGAPLSSVTILVDGGAHGSFFANLGGYRSDVQSANVNGGHWSPHDITYSGWSFSFVTSGLSAGSHSFTAIAYDNTYGVSATIGSQSFTVSALFGQTVNLSPGSQTVYAGTNLTFTASGGANGYVWGGAAGGGGNSQLVSFPNPGSYLVTVYSPSGNGYNQSNTASATITAAPVPTAFSAAPTSFAYNGGVQGPIVSSSPSGATYNLSGIASAINAGSYSYTATATGNYTGSNVIYWNIIPAGQSLVSLSPATATISAGLSVGFTASGGSGTGSYIWGGQASGTGSTNTVIFNSAGSFSVSVYKAADSNHAQSNTAVASVTVVSSTYTLTVNAGPGGTASGSAGGLAGNATPTIAASPSAGYGFVNWTGDPVANSGAASTTVPMNNANRTVTANFVATLQPQTITFTPPATAVYPGPTVALVATATSGLPVSFTLLSGPAILAGNQLTFSGAGKVIVQASQGGGWNGGFDYQAASSVNGSIQVNTLVRIVRLRFNSPAVVNNKSTNNTSVDANNIGHSSMGKVQSSFIWTDPNGIQGSPWPSFNNPGGLAPIQGNVQLPLAPVASPGQSNVIPKGLP